MQVIRTRSFSTILLFSMLLTRQTSMAQDKMQDVTFGVQACIDYAVAHATEVKNATINEEMAVLRIKEVVGIGLPQISGVVTVSHSPKLSKFFGTYSSKSSIGPTPAQAAQAGIEEGDIFAAQNFFQLKGAGDARLTINQLIFNGSFIVGLTASKAYQALTIKQKDKTIGEVSVDITKAYFNVLINEDRLRLFAANLARLDTTYSHTLQLHQNGFVEQIDVDRLKVSLNNLKTEYQSIQNLSILSKRLLKFQMNFPLDQPLLLSGTIEEVLSSASSPLQEPIDYTNRPDYQVLLANKHLEEVNLKYQYAKLLPVISGYAQLGYNTQSPTFGGIFTTTSTFSDLGDVGPDKWYAYSNVGLKLSWNLFSGLQQKYQIQQQKLNLEMIDNNINQLENLISIEVRDAVLTHDNAIKKFEIQKENIGIAARVFRISQIKYQEGVGSNLEVVEADSALKNAQNNYYNALFEMIIAKIDLNSATGINAR